MGILSPSGLEDFLGACKSSMLVSCPHTVPNAQLFWEFRVQLGCPKTAKFPILKDLLGKAERPWSSYLKWLFGSSGGLVLRAVILTTTLRAPPEVNLTPVTVEASVEGSPKPNPLPSTKTRKTVLATPGSALLSPLDPTPNTSGALYPPKPQIPRSAELWKSGDPDKTSQGPL